MNGYQRIQAALKGEKTDTTPIMLHNFMLATKVQLLEKLDMATLKS